MWSAYRRVFFIIVLLLQSLPLFAADTPLDLIRLPITRGTSISDVDNEALGNNGGAAQLKVKSFQEFSVLDFDPAALKCHGILSAELHVRLSGPEVLHRITFSSLASEWVEGTDIGYRPQTGSSCFQWRKSPDVPWAQAGSDMCSVMLSEGNTIWRSADASPPDRDRWQTIPVDPNVLGARAAGISGGVIIFDDTGSEWSHAGEKFTLRIFPNRFFYSPRQQNGAPYLTVVLGPADVSPPPAPTGLHADPADLAPGEIRVSWITPRDVGPAGTIGFFVDIDGKSVPRYLIPMAGKPGERVTMHVRDMHFTSGQTIRVTVRAVDAAGNVGQAVELITTVSAQAIQPIEPATIKPFTGNAPLPKLGDAEVAVIDALDKVQGATGKMIPPQPDGYLSANHLWNAATKTIRLQAARGEYVSFQILLRGPAAHASASLVFPPTPNPDTPTIRFFQLANVDSNIGPVPDPLIPSDGSFADTPDARSLLCELYVPVDAAAGQRRAAIELRSAGKQLSLRVDITIWDFTLPKFLSFLPEMNCYGLGADEMAYYRLAHLNRTVLNRLPYEHNGYVDAAPKWDGHKLDFASWDKRFGPLFDGSAFAGDPRQGVPIECFYLPMFENWPTPIEGNYNGSYWADHAFTKSYRNAFVSAARQFAEHFNEKGWNQTIFQCYFNGKVEYKQHGWSRETCPWVLDEPTNFQDFWALRWFGQAFHEGVDPVHDAQGVTSSLFESHAAAKLLFRCDVSRPQWQRDSLDGVLNYAVVADGVFQQYPRIVLDRKAANDQVLILYGSSNSPTTSNTQPAEWCVNSYLDGADGVLPWQTIGTAESWKKADALALFYPSRKSDPKGPCPSIRLKSYLRGEEDVEYLALLASLRHESQLQLARDIRAALGRSDLMSLKPQELWALRVRIGEMLSRAHPPAKDRLRDRDAATASGRQSQ